MSSRFARLFALKPVTQAIALTGLTALGCAIAPVAQAESLSQLFNKAKANSASYQSARAQFEANKAKAAQANAAVLPTVGLGASSNWTRTDPNGSAAMNTNGQTIGLQASHPLYNEAKTIQQAQGQLLNGIGEEVVRKAEQALIIEVSQAYFDVLAARDTLNLVQTQKKAVGEQLAAAKRNFEVGTATITDSREAQARFDLVQAQEIAAQNDLTVKTLALQQVVGAPLEANPIPPTATLPQLNADELPAWVDKALANSPDLRLAATGLKSAQFDVEAAKAANGPTVALTGSLGLGRSYNTTARDYITANQAVVGVSLNLPLYSGGAIDNRIQETLALQTKAENDLEVAKRAVSQATRAAYLGVLSGQGQIEALKAAEASSQSALEANQLGYQVGVRINIDVLNAQTQLFQTRTDLAKARYNVLLGQLKLKQATGVLNEDDLTPISGLAQ